MPIPTAALPATCSAYLAPGKIDLTKNVVTFDTTTTSTVGWLTAKDCLTDLNSSLATEKAALITANYWQYF